MASMIQRAFNTSLPVFEMCFACSRLFLRPVHSYAFFCNFTNHDTPSNLSRSKPSHRSRQMSSAVTSFSGQRNIVWLHGSQASSCSRSFSTEQGDQNQIPPKKKSVAQSKKSPISWKTLLIVAGFGGAFAIGLQMVKKEKEEEMKKNRTRQMGKALLGGDWTLTDHHGKLRSSTDFRGQWILIYFGFTNCPDICPEEIEKIVRVIDQTDADKSLPKIQPIVITVDPERDTPEALKEYCGEFSPRLLGFTGTIEEITAATRAYRVYFSAGPKDEDNDYIVDHSIISYLVNPQGEFVDYFGQNKKSDEIFNSIKLHISAYNIAEKNKK